MRESSVGKEDIFLVTFLSCLLSPSIGLVVYTDTHRIKINFHYSN